MKKETKLFEDLFLSNELYFNSMGYFFKQKELLNKDSKEEFMQYFFFNKNLKKEIVFTFYPSTGKYVNNAIGVGFTIIDRVGNYSSMSIPHFLAYKELNRKIQYEDTEKYDFNVDPERLEESIKEQLDKIIDLLNTDLYKIFTTETWIKIPFHDPRDDY